MKLCKEVRQSAYSLLELGQVSGAQSVRFCNDRDKVDPGAESFHHLNVEGLEVVTSGPDEIKTGVDTEVNLILSARLLLLEHVGFMLVIEKLNNGHPRVPVVDVVPKAGGINDSKTNWNHGVNVNARCHVCPHPAQGWWLDGATRYL